MSSRRINGANSVLHYGKGGEIASNRHDEQEMTVLCLRILQAALVCVNTLMARCPHRRRLGTAGHRRGPSRTDTAVLAARAGLRRGQTRHDRPPQPPSHRAYRQPVNGCALGAPLTQPTFR
jgi:hypothetical protein